MAGSALIGTTPKNENDALIRRGLILLNPSALNPIPGEPFGPPKPVNATHESWGESLQIGTAFALFLVIFFTTTRLWVRKFHANALGMDDLVIVPAALSCMTYLICTVLQTAPGCLGQHIWDCTYSGVANYYEWAQVEYPVFYLTVFTAKLSIALQNRRITLMASKRWQYVHWTFIAIFIILIPLMTLLELFRCDPLAISYSIQYLAKMSNPKKAKCSLDTKGLEYAPRAIHAATDVALLSVPIIIVFRLQAPWRKRARLIAIFAIGGLSTVASIVRNVNFGHDGTDITWETRAVYAFDVIDVTTALVVANLPALNTSVDVAYEKVKNLSSIFSKSSLNLSWHRKHSRGSDKMGYDSDEKFNGIQKNTSIRSQVSTIQTHEDQRRMAQGLPWVQEDIESQ